MRLLVCLLFLLLFSNALISQSIRLNGNVTDTSGGLRNALMMAIKFNDSTLVGYSRTNAQGIFKELVIPKDTYVVVLSHPSFSDKTYLLVPGPQDTAFRFKNVVLPPKSTVLKEVEIFAYKEKSYYKGDTLVFTADSFRTRPNATVEELLKKLPGFRVDAEGKITIQGKQVDQVLVDGDEFFGSDPTIATKNLSAASIANVQVYDKKNDNTSEGQDETLKVLNLQMKDDAKKGYFGKAAIASDMQQFYESQLLLNRFKGNRKYSIFGLGANTPKQGFSGNDAWKYGLEGEQQWQYNEETDQWTGRERNVGIPRTTKAGAYFSDKFNKKTKLNTDYTFNQNSIEQLIETNTQFFLPDTGYSNARVRDSRNQNTSHGLNITFTHKLDSLTELVIAPKVKYNMANSISSQTDDFLTSEGLNTRNTSIRSNNTTENTEANGQLRINRSFMKKDRKLTVSYQPNYSRTENKTKLNTDFYYFYDQLPDSHLVQDRKQVNEKTDHNISGIFTEPLTKKFKTEISYQYSQSRQNSSRNTFDIDDAANDIFNPLLSNNFENLRVSHRAGLKLIYDVKKYRISVGSNVREIHQENLNKTTGTVLQQNVRNYLPLATFQYRVNQGSNLQLTYFSSSQLPDLQQMQPVIDNSDPNRLSLGNPDLRPTFNHNISLNYYFYKGISDRNFWSGARFSQVQDQISNSTYFDSLGRAITQPINVDGNYNGNFWFGGGFPVLKKFMKIYYNMNGGTSQHITVVNNVYNTTQNHSIGPSLTFEKDAEKYEVSLGGRYNYTMPRSSINSAANQPFYTYGLEGSITVKLPQKFLVVSDANYTNNGNRSPGYNLNFLIWNATLGRAFLKTENLIVTANVYDILNQNINNQRNVTGNQVIDTKTQIIRRYFLLRVMYKFNNQKTKVEDDDSY